MNHPATFVTAVYRPV